MVYLDHAATTALLPEAADAYISEMAHLGNPSSLHTAGRRARRVVEESRESLAESIGARPSEIVFTAGGTEADNLAVKGLYWARRDADARRRVIVTSAIEHHAVADPLHWLVEHEGAEVIELPVDQVGRVDPADLEAIIDARRDEIALITVMWANNEVGTVQPVGKLAGLAREAEIPIHSDAVQAFGHLPLDFASSGLDAMTVTAHKLGGPLGVGALVLGRGVEVVPLLHGGGQERDVRSGTLDAPAVASFAAAAEVSVGRRAAIKPIVRALRDRLMAGVLEQVPEAIPNGDQESCDECSLPGIAHLTFPGCEGDDLLLLLDARGIECSTGSACSAGIAQPSHVLLALGASPEVARSSLRFSLGHTSTGADVDALLDAIGPVVARARRNEQA